MNEYQAVYDAVRSRIGNCDIGGAVSEAMHSANLSHYVEQAAHGVVDVVHAAFCEYARPSAVYRPALSIDGNQWCALYGANLEDGVAGFGDSPELAMQNFDANWVAALPWAGNK